MSILSSEMLLIPLPVVYIFYNFEWLMSILSMEMFLTPLPVVYTFYNFEMVNVKYTFYNFELVNVNSLVGDVPYFHLCGVYILQL